MKCPKKLLVAVGLMTFVSPCALGSEIKVIANSSVKTDVISKGEIERIFLEEKSSFDDGSHAQPVLEKDGSVHEAFLREYMGRTDDDLQSFYRALVFAGRGSLPKQLNSDAEVVAYVARTRGAIGYVNSGTDTAGVKTLAVAERGNDSQRRLITRIEPDYPEILRRLNIGGTVRLKITISARGSVENVQLVGGNPILAEVAANAVKRWVYSSSHSRTTAEIVIPFDPGR
jgi:TonB family protein